MQTHEGIAPQRRTPPPASFEARPLLTGAEGPNEITYALGARTKAGRTMIKSIENITGRPRLLKMALDYQAEMADGASFWEVMRRRYRLSIEYVGDGLKNLPESGPLVCVANHPFGILDGLMFGHIMDQRRGGDFKILANSVFVKAPEVEPHILPIDFAETREAVRSNLETRKHALDYLKAGGAIGVFPGGAVSTMASLYRRAYDPEWKTFTARLIQQSGAAVCPIFFDGQNSRLFQLASHLSDTLRLALLINEFDNRVGGPVRIVIGDALPKTVIDGFRGDARGLMRFLREHVYSLSPTPIPRRALGKAWD
ncbi:MAG: lysophospholipid acyltransferase family protein [Pseudomonadota bacterium]